MCIARTPRLARILLCNSVLLFFLFTFIPLFRSCLTSLKTSPFLPDVPLFVCATHAGIITLSVLSSSTLPSLPLVHRGRRKQKNDGGSLSLYSLTHTRSTLPHTHALLSLSHTHAMRVLLLIISHYPASPSSSSS